MFIQKPGPDTFLTLGCLNSWKNKKIGHFSKGVETEWEGAGGVEVFFALRRHYRLSVAVWWYIFVSKPGAKAIKMATKSNSIVFYGIISPHLIVCLIIVLHIFSY